MPTINISFGDIKMYSLLLALIYIAFISLGLPDSLLGSGWPVIHTDLDVPISFMGIISMTISVQCFNKNSRIYKKQPWI